MSQLITSIIISIGLVFLTASINDARNIANLVPTYRWSWKIILNLILFFVVGYILTLLFMAEDSVKTVAFLTALVYLGSGFFVFLVIYVSRKTLSKILQADLLQDENTQIKIIKSRLQNILDTAVDGIITFSESGMIESSNNAACSLFGYTEEELKRLKIWDLLTEYDDDLINVIAKTEGKELKLEAKKRRGDVFPISFKAKGMQLRGQKLYTTIIVDISEQKQMLEKMQHLVDHDDLTALYNRRFFLQRLAEIVEQQQRGGQPSSLLYLDLDHFKDVNDTFGHDSGDRLLINVSRVLRQGRRKSDCVARLGGDEFVILLYNAKEKEAFSIAERVRAALAKEVFTEEENAIHVTCSIGIVTIGDERISPEEFMKKADAACYAAKEGGRDMIVAYDKTKHQQIMRRMERESG